MTGLFKAEWIKLTRRWVLRVMTLVLLVLVLLSAALLLIVPSISPGTIEGIPELSRADATLLGVQTVLGQTWFPLILAVVLLGTEVTTGAWAAALTRDARRMTHLFVRLIVLSVAAWLASLLAIAGWEVLAAIFTDGPAAFGFEEWFGVVWKAGLVQTAWVALGLGAITLVRSTGIAIAAVLAYSFLEGLLALWAPYGEIAFTTATAQLFGELSADLSGGLGIGGSDPMSFVQALLIVMAWGALGFGLATLGVKVREP